jgi:hypothetical protein
MLDEWGLTQVIHRKLWITIGDLYYIHIIGRTTISSPDGTTISSLEGDHHFIPDNS